METLAVVLPILKQSVFPCSTAPQRAVLSETVAKVEAIVWYTYLNMTRHFLIRILAVVLLLASLLAPVRAAIWFCEGRQCGTTLWQCCCNSESGRDLKCDQPDDTQAEASACPAGCNCVMVITAVPDSDVATSASFMSPPLAHLPLPIPAYSVSVVEKPILYGMETRGPPFACVVFATPSLRAPPIA